MNGLVLEGGAMRGLFTAGALDVWLEGGIAFDGIIGVSAGACFGCNYKSRQPGRVIRYNKRFARDPRYCSWRSLLRTGDLFGAKFCYHTLPDELDPFDSKAFSSDPTAFYVVTTDCVTGKPTYTRLDSMDYEALEWIRASASMPVVARPVQIGGSFHLDGGLSDGIPLRHFESIGYAKNVVVTTRPHGYRKFPSLKTAMAKPFLRRFPAVYEALVTRHQWYNRTLEYIDERVAAGAALLVAPQEPLPIHRICHNSSQMQAVYDIGRQAGFASLPRIKSFLSQAY